MVTRVKEKISVAKPKSGHPNPLISHETLRQLYIRMLQCRLLNECVLDLGKKTGWKKDFASLAGTEATVVGATIDLRGADTLALSRRDFLLSYLKEVPLADLFRELIWSEQQINRGELVSHADGFARLADTLPTPTHAVQWDMCTDVAHACQRSKSDNVVMAFSGSDLIATSVWRDALRAAARHVLPIVFVREMNAFPRSASVTSDALEGCANVETGDIGFPVIAVDGKDAVAMYRVAHEAIERARSSGGPTLIDAHSFHRYELNSLDGVRSRKQDQLEPSAGGDPIASMERYLAGKGLFSKSWKDRIVAAFQRELDAAMHAAEVDRCGASA